VIGKSGENLTEALQVALLPIAKMMIKRGLGAGDLIEAAKNSYVHAAVSELMPSGAKVNVSRLAVATGLTRKEVTSLLQRKNERRLLFSSKKILQQRALRVLRGWNMDPIFQRESGRPADLPLRGEQRSFQLLVKKHGGDVTPVSVLRELDRMKAVTTTRSGKIRLRKRTMEPSMHVAQQLAELAHLLGDFTRTVQQITESGKPPLFFGFKDSIVNSPHQAALFQRTFSRRAASLLEGIEQWATHQTKERSRKQGTTKSKTRVGLGVYLVQED